MMSYPPAAGCCRLGRAVRRSRHRACVGPIIGANSTSPPPRDGAAAATFGLIAGGLLGGPLGHRLSRAIAFRPGRRGTHGRRQLRRGNPAEARRQRHPHHPSGHRDRHCRFRQLNDLLEAVGFTLPKFVSALFCGMVLSNTVPRLVPRLGWPTGSAPLALVAELALGLFLSMSLMTLNLASLAGVALPLFVILAAQVTVAWLLISRVCSACGRDRRRRGHLRQPPRSGDDTTPTAIADFTATSRRYRASPRLVSGGSAGGAFYVDIANAIVLQTFLERLGDGRPAHRRRFVFVCVYATGRQIPLCQPFPSSENAV